MRLFNYYIVIVCFSINYGFAHDTNEAFFKIVQKGDVLEVQAEFPWTIRNAVLQEFPELKDSKSQEDFDVAFFNYVKKYLIINNGKNTLALLTIDKGELDGHSHQNSYIFRFKGGRYTTIGNTLMCNLSVRHKNYHEVQVQGAFMAYMTSKETTGFVVDANLKSNIGDYSCYYISIIVVFGVLFFGYYKGVKN